MQNPIFENVQYLLKVEGIHPELLRRLKTESYHAMDHDTPLVVMNWIGQTLEALRNFRGQADGDKQLKEVMEQIATEFSSWVLEIYGDATSVHVQNPEKFSEKPAPTEERSLIGDFDDLPNWGVSKWPCLQFQVDLISTMASSSPASLTRAVSAFGQIRNSFDRLPLKRQKQVLTACESLALAIQEAVNYMLGAMKTTAQNNT